MNQLDFIVFDFETGGLDPKHHEAIELAAKAYDARTLEPYPAVRAWRARVELSYLDNPNALYFGHTSATMNYLSHSGQSFKRYEDYRNSLVRERAGAVGEAALVTDWLELATSTQSALAYSASVPIAWSFKVPARLAPEKFTCIE